MKPKALATSLLFAFALIALASPTYERIASLGAFTVTKEVSQYGTYVFASTEATSQEDGTKTATMFLSCLDLLPFARIQLNFHPRNEGKLTVLYHIDGKRPVVEDWFASERKNGLSIIGPNTLDSSFWRDLEEAKWIKIMFTYQKEPRSAIGTQLTFVFSLDGYKRLVDYMPCLFARWQ